MNFFRLCFCVGLLAVPLGSASAADCALKKLASFDATLESGAVVIAVQIDGQTVSAMLDTGSPYNLINKTLADRLKLPMQQIREGAMIDATGGSIKHLTKAHSVTVGDIRTEGTPFFVMGEARQVEEGPDVILGASFLEANDLELDLAHGKVNMFMPDHCPGQVVYWTHEFVPIPIRLFNQGHIILPVTLNGVETHAMLDTGAGLTTVSTRLVQSELGIDPAAENAKTGYATAGTGARQLFYRHQFDSLDIGGIQFHHTELAIAPDTMNRMIRNSVNDPHMAVRMDDTINTPMILGMSHLAKLRLYFSFKEQMLYVTPANAH